MDFALVAALALCAVAVIQTLRGGALDNYWNDAGACLDSPPADANCN